MPAASRILGKNQDSPWLYLLVALGAFYFYWISTGSKHSPAFYDTTDFIRSHGYPAETHTVLTKDGYLLDIHRIPRSRDNSTGSRPPVLLQHGFLCSSSIWVYRGPGKDLAFILSDQGYDVWLLNVRGNSYSKLHHSAATTFNDFSWHEIGTLDLPASIDYILEVTGHQNVSYIGHSMGTTLLFAGLATQPEYNEKINHAVVLAPLINRKNLTEVSHTFFEFLWMIGGKTGNDLVDYMGLFKRSWILTSVKYFIFQTLPYFPVELFTIMFKNFAGAKSSCQISEETYKLISYHSPDGLTHYILNHYHNNVDEAEFLMRDYGETENIKRYNSTKPPSYNLSFFKVPTTVYMGDADSIAPPSDFLQELPHLGQRPTIKTFTNFNHFDLLWANEATDVIYFDVLQELNKALNKN